MKNTNYVNRVVFKKTWWEVYAHGPNEGPGSIYKCQTAQEAYKEAVVKCNLGFNDAPRVEVRVDQVTRESRVIDTPGLIQETIMERLDEQS